MNRFASTRSENRAVHPGPSPAQRVGSIDDVGMRYGFTTHCLIARTIATAPTIVTTQSIARRQGSGSRPVSLSTGFLKRLPQADPARREVDREHLSDQVVPGK